MSNRTQRATVKIESQRRRTKVSFEPIGNDFELELGETIYLDVPLADLGALEVVVWDTGIAIWLPYPGEHIVRDGDGHEITRL